MTNIKHHLRKYYSHYELRKLRVFTHFFKSIKDENTSIFDLKHQSRFISHVYINEMFRTFYKEFLILSVPMKIVKICRESNLRKKKKDEAKVQSSEFTPALQLAESARTKYF